jgi:peptidoglycan/xylan/chitin deacetylase (PgdA/CDA1 family)
VRHGSHAAKRRSRGFSGRAVAVVIGVPLGLAGLAIALTSLGPSEPSPSAATVEATTTQIPVDSSEADPTPPAPPSEPVDVSPSAEPTDQPEPGTGATGPSGRSEYNRANPGLDVVWRVETEDPVFFLTIDDNVKDPAVAQAGLGVIDKYQIPVTAFLSTNYVANDTDYFNAVVRHGGSVQNHTVTHPWLDNPNTDVRFELCTARERLTQQFGSDPWMLRPPYGAPYFSGGSTARVEAAAAECGINRIVMWNAVVDNGQVSYNPGPTLRAGDIVLMHFWDPKFAEGLELLMEIARQNGLSPAPLEDYI